MTAPYWTDGQVTLYHGDCRDITDWLAADVLVTDPPYGAQWGTNPLTSYTTRNPRKKRLIRGDDSTEIRDAALTLWAGHGPVVVFGTWRRPRPERVAHRLIWYKRQQAPGVRNCAFYPAEEEIYLVGSGWTGKPIQNVICTDEVRQGVNGAASQAGHPAPKPVGLMETLISKCPPGVIADPFAGSGSTLVAARHQGRQAIGVEIVERYCELAARRLAQGVLTA